LKTERASCAFRLPEGSVQRFFVLPADRLRLRARELDPRPLLEREPADGLFAPPTDFRDPFLDVLRAALREPAVFDLRDALPAVERGRFAREPAADALRDRPAGFRAPAARFLEPARRPLDDDLPARPLPRPASPRPGLPISGAGESTP
jgi:hypothetical protein